MTDHNRYPGIRAEVDAAIADDDDELEDHLEDQAQDRITLRDKGEG